ncbi:glycolate oxidase subunit GlcE [Pseudomonas sp. Marseille-QA0892]
MNTATRVERSHDQADALLETVRDAVSTGQPLAIRGGDSKAFLGKKVEGHALDVRAHAGIVQYDPTELVITARAGTTLAELTAALDAGDQMLAFEPPLFDGEATLGGTIASGLSGPRRPWVGSARDFVLGTRVLTGQGKHLRFGGEVMKNVAGYDLSRLMAASFGCLGVITEVSLKVLPKPRMCRTLRLEVDAERALARLAEWGQQPLPISGASHDGTALHLRLEGGEGSVEAACDRLGGETLDGEYWEALRDWRLPFFSDARPLWRISVPIATPCLALPGDQLIDWGGGQRWLKSDADEDTIRRIVEEVGGHAACYTAGAARSPFHPLPASLLRYHRQLKARLDPKGIFNPGRLYAEI